MKFPGMVFAEGIEEFIRTADEAFPPDFSSLSLDQQRACYAKLCQAFETDRPKTVAVVDQTIELEDRSIGLRIYRPHRSDPGPSPCLLYFHGGGFIFGNLDSHDGVTAELAEQTGALVIAVDYRLAPEHRHPCASEDSWAALQWLWSSADALAVDPTRIVAAGDSAGGNLAMGLAFRARSQPRPPLAGVVLIYPGLGLCLADPDHPTGPDAPGLTAAEMDYYKDLYLGEGGAWDDPRAFPLFETDYAGLPPVYVQAAALDPLAQDGQALAARIRAAGGDCESEVFAGLIHGHLRARRLVPQAAQAFRAALAAVRRFIR